MNQDQAYEFNLRAAIALKWKRHGDVFFFPENTPLTVAMKSKYVLIENMHFHDEESWELLLYSEAVITDEGRNQFWGHMEHDHLIADSALKVLEKLESEA